MEKVLKPFVVLSTYVVLYAVTYSFISAVISALFWVNYFDVIHSNPMGIFLVLCAGSHLVYASIKECEK
jgi:hypothetical protein